MPDNPVGFPFFGETDNHNRQELKRSSIVTSLWTMLWCLPSPNPKVVIKVCTRGLCSTVMDGCIDVVFYDITTLYFEAADEDDLRRTEYAIDGKFDCT